MNFISICRLGLLIGLFFSGGATSGSVIQQSQQSLLASALFDLRTEFAPFLDTVLRQISSDSFFVVVDRIKQEEHPATDAEWYQALERRIKAAQPLIGRYTPWYKLTALRYQRSILGQQMKSLLNNEAALQVQTAVEIGKPATYIATLRDSLPNLKKVYAINDMQKSFDGIEAFTLKKPFSAYDQFIPLKNYDPIVGIPVASVDLVVCTIGLHHIPPEKLEPFVASIRSILRPGGIFILRDHDARTTDLIVLAHAAHSVFNVVLAGEVLAAEQAEYRNFQPLGFWIALLQRHGFDVGIERLLQEGDPTLNTMIRATASARTVEERELVITKKLAVRPGYTRDLMQTYLTSPEWLSVDISQEYGNFINHTPFYEFPWMDSLASYWKVFNGSCKAAIAQRGILPVVASPYMLMNLFIGVMTTVEHIAKAALSAPIRWSYSGAEPEMLQALVFDPRNELVSLDPTSKVLASYEDDLVLVELSRYKRFLNLIQRCAQDDIEVQFVEIAGQQEIQCKVRAKSSDYEPLIQMIRGTALLYQWALPTQQDYTYAAITVPVKELKRFVQLLKKQDIELLYVHDF